MRKLLTEQDIIDRAELRKLRRSALAYLIANAIVWGFIAWLAGWL